MSTINDFFKSKKILITGHTGFIGSWLTKWLTMIGSTVCGYSLGPPSDPNIYEVLSLGTEIESVKGDILDQEKLSKCVKDFVPDITVHLAAQSLVLKSYLNPIETFAVNVQGTANLLETLKMSGSNKTIVVFTSDKVYENNESFYPYREIDRLGGKSPYSASKSCQDILVTSFYESYFKDSDVSVVSIRAGNTIGGGDWAEYRIIPDMVRALSKGKEIELRNPYAIRPWQHVLDPLYGTLTLIKKLWNDISYSGPWNFGGDWGMTTTVQELTDEFIKNWGSGSYRLQKKNPYRESQILRLDSSKARTLLNWQKRYSFEEAVKITVNWYKSYYKARGDIINITESQILSVQETGGKKSL